MDQGFWSGPLKTSTFPTAQQIRQVATVLPITTNTTVHRIYEGFVSVLNLEELNAAVGQLLVYPNPTTGAITIHSTKAMNQGYTIHDQMGRTVVTGELNGYDTHVSLSHLAKGMYILKVNGNYKPAQLAKE
jgi:hypothetical protein